MNIRMNFIFGSVEVREMDVLVDTTLERVDNDVGRDDEGA